MTWLTGLIRNSFLQNLKPGCISASLCFQEKQTVFLTRRISLEIYAIQSSFRVFPFVFFTRSVIEPAPQNSITSCKTSISIQPTINSYQLSRQSSKIRLEYWFGKPSWSREYNLFYISAWKMDSNQMSSMCVRHVWNTSHISCHIFKDWFNHCNLMLGIWICSAMQNALAAAGVRAHPMLKESNWSHDCDTLFLNSHLLME